jgi:hypothetical protein
MLPFDWKKRTTPLSGGHRGECANEFRAASYAAGLIPAACLEASTIFGNRMLNVEPRPGSLSTVMSWAVVEQHIDCRRCFLLN